MRGLWAPNLQAGRLPAVQREDEARAEAVSFQPVPLEALERRKSVYWPPELIERRQHLSASSITMLLRCPEQFRRRYILKEIKPPNGNMLWGKADGAAAAAHFDAVIATGEKKGLTVDEVEERFVHSIDTQIEEAGGITEVLWDKKPSSIKQAHFLRGRTVDVGTKMAGLYRKEIADSVNPVATEREIKVTDPSWPVHITGYIDVEDELEMLIEKKTSNRLNSKPNPEWVLQGRIYQLAEPNKALAWHQSIKHDDPKKVRVFGFSDEMTVAADSTRAFRTSLMVSQAMAEVAHYWSTYGPDEMWPGKGQTHTWACSLCGWRDECGWLV